MASRWVHFGEVENPGRKTKIWWVRATRDDMALGEIRWWPAWRQYCFFPKGSTIWNPECLDDVTAFVREKMAERRAAKATAPERCHCGKSCCMIHHTHISPHSGCFLR